MVFDLVVGQIIVVFFIPRIWEKGKLFQKVVFSVKIRNV